MTRIALCATTLTGAFSLVMNAIWPTNVASIARGRSCTVHHACARRCGGRRAGSMRRMRLISEATMPPNSASSRTPLATPRPNTSNPTLPRSAWPACRRGEGRALAVLKVGYGSEAEPHMRLDDDLPTTEWIVSPFGRDGQRHQAARCGLQSRRNLSSLGSGDYEFSLPAAAAGAHKAIPPIGNSHLGPVSLHHLAGVGLDLTAAVSTPNDQPDPGLGSVTERHRRTAIGLHRS
jgi:hypothetical protein